MDNFDSLLFQAARTAQRSAVPTPCPEVEMLADYAAGRLSEARQEGLERHLAGCPLCIDLVMLSRSGELEDEDGTTVPQRVLSGVLDLIPARPSLLEVALRLVSDGMEMLRQTGAVLSSRPLAVRGGAVQVSTPDVAQQYTFQREFPPYVAQFSVQRQDSERVALTLSLREETAPARSLQVELWQEGRLRGVRSGVGGAVTFTDIKPGEYRLTLISGEQQAGEVHLSLLE